ncbi:MAG: peptidoglycan-associated lipoprotein [Cytophagaceae bacterium]|jgi:outer membrane protein OmpA-like peptidoglycan-associated protein|nr:peptidoglycan-associated lipoprotein [Cytophagaceae bacterium]
MTTFCVLIKTKSGPNAGMVERVAMKIQNIRLLYFFCMLSIFTGPVMQSSYAQDLPADQQLVLVADEMYNFGDVKDALEVYVQALEMNPKNERANFMAGKAYLTTTQKDLALKYLIKSYELNPNVADNILLLIGTAYHLNYEFDNAISFYNQYRTKIIMNAEGAKPFGEQDNASEEKKIERKIYECETGKVYIKNPLDIELFNLGDGVNSEFKDYGPILNTDRTKIYFTSRRKGSTGGNKDNDNEFFEDIYRSDKVGSAWSTAVNLGYPVNSDLHESCIGISSDEQELFLYIDNDKYKGDIFYCKKDNKGNWGMPKSLSKQINTADFIENSMSITPDGKTLFFSSNKPGGFGGQDIYVSKKDAKGEWGIPVNLGSYLNTEYDDESPFLDTDGKTLYFSSKGHRGMGGFDIYKSRYDSTTQIWSKPENLLYPINSTEDDTYFILSDDGVYGYFSSNKNIGLGDADIYRFRMPDKNIKTPPVFKADSVTFTLIDKDSLKKNEYNIKINITDKETGQLLEAEVQVIDVEDDDKSLDQSISTQGLYDKKLTFAKKTKLVVSIKKDGYIFQDISIKIDPESQQNRTVTRTITMEKPVVGSKYVLRNLYYDFDKADLRKESHTELNNLLKLLQGSPNMKIEIGSHTDDMGSKDYNYSLSQRRAQSVVNWLIEKGINASRLIPKGYGEDEPLVSNDDEKEGRELNRRTEVKILSN